MPKRTSPAKTAAGSPPPVNVVMVTLDSHMASATDRARAQLEKTLPGLSLNLHAAAEWEDDPDSLRRCRDDIAQGDIIIVTMLFVEEHIRPVLDALQARRDECDAMICCMTAGEVIRLTRMGGFRMDGSQGGPLALLKRLRGSKNKKKSQSSGAGQMAAIRRIPQFLRFIPGTAQDVRAYFLTLQYFLAGSEENIVNMVNYLVDRYADGPRAALKGKIKSSPPVEYPEVGVYHPRLKERMTEKAARLPAPKNAVGTVGLLVMRSYVLAGNTNHYDGVIGAMEAQGLKVVTAFASGLDARETVSKFFLKDGQATVDAVVSMSGFSLIGGPAYNDSRAAEDMLAELDVPVIAAHPVEFQTLEQWESSDRGLTPLEATMMVAIPELDGTIGSMVFGGRSDTASNQLRDMQVHPERAAMLAARVAKLVRLRRKSAKDRNIAVVLFNFPPNGGATGTAAYLSVFASLHKTLKAMKAEGYDVEVPETVDDLRDRILGGNARQFGTDANVHAHIAADDHVAREQWLDQIEEQWGPAPGKVLSNGASIFVLGAQFGKVFVGIQPGFGYEGDPMRMLFDKGFAPTHAFSAFYRYLKEDYDADAVLHFGMHGALEFMPGKQTGLSAACWPDRLIGDLPNFYLYAANNPSEGTIAKRRSAATMITYLTPPIAHAGLYESLADLKETIDRWRSVAPEDLAERESLVAAIQAQAAQMDLALPEPAWNGDSDIRIAELREKIQELEYTLIPNGLHVLGEPPSAEERVDLLLAIAEASHGERPDRRVAEALVAGKSAPQALKAAGLKANETTLTMVEALAKTDRLLTEDHEIPSILHALNGGYIRPAPGGDLLRTPDVLPTGRNLHGFDPFRIPSAFALSDGARQAERVLQRYIEDGHEYPESIAIVLWGTDNLKSGGGPIAQVLALLGTRPRFDSYGRLCGAELIPLEDLGRPRVDVVVTLSGIFRDLLPLQTRVLAEAAYLAAAADEPVDQNFVRKHALAYMDARGCDLETAALRVFSNADGAYGANVNQMIDSSAWSDEDDLAEAFVRRKGYAYGRTGQPVQQSDLLQAIMGDVTLAYQNLESVELGVTTIDHYFDALGGLSRVASRTTGSALPVYVSDQTQSEGCVRSLNEQVALETRTRMLNPKWYEGMLKHGYEGVRQIEAQVTNTMGWSATTGQVEPWVYQKITQTFVLDAAMRDRLASLNPAAASKVASRLLEAHERQYWTPDPEMLDALREAGEDLEDRLEGIGAEAVA